MFRTSVFYFTEVLYSRFYSNSYLTEDNIDVNKLLILFTFKYLVRGEDWF